MKEELPEPHQNSFREPATSKQIPLYPTKKAIATVTILLTLVAAFTFVVGTNMAYPVGYNQGATVGYTTALSDVANLLTAKRRNLRLENQH